MASFFNYLMVFALGGSIAYLLAHKQVSPKDKKKELNQLQSDNGSLEVDKINLQNRNGELVKIISRNQRDIKDLGKENKDLKEDFREVIRHQMTILELLSNVTKIRDQGDINANIIITERLAKKYNLF